MRLSIIICLLLFVKPIVGSGRESPKEYENQDSDPFQYLDGELSEAGIEPSNTVGSSFSAWTQPTASGSIPLQPYEDNLYFNNTFFDNYTLGQGSSQTVYPQMDFPQQFTNTTSNLPQQSNDGQNVKHRMVYIRDEVPENIMSESYRYKWINAVGERDNYHLARYLEAGLQKNRKYFGCKHCRRYVNFNRIN
uniref:Uncharacterized protein n=1 Tax=Meloidogyne hapla TaxID=6305 RepID=A0A1I8BDA9_MELHA